MAFELTNFGQRGEFQEISDRAWAGDLFKEAKDDGRDAVNFAYANEFIEQMKKSFPEEEFHDWYFHIQVSDYKLIGKTFRQYIADENSAPHIDYYKKIYEEKIKPQVLDNQNEMLTERMRALQNTGEITSGNAGKYIKKDGQWVEAE